MFKRRKLGTAGGRSGVGASKVVSDCAQLENREKDDQKSTGTEFPPELSGALDSLGPAQGPDPLNTLDQPCGAIESQPDVTECLKGTCTSINGHRDPKPSHETDDSVRAVGKQQQLKYQHDGSKKPKDHIPGKASPNRSLPSKQPTIFHDLQPNICKDYHKTGYCTYGDTCKFAHIRDLHPAKVPAVKPKQEVVTTCPICNRDPTKPGKLKCGHSCCLECFLKSKPKKCPRCDAATNESISMG